MRSRSRSLPLTLLGLGLLPIVVYWRAGNYPFVNFDDPVMVVYNFPLRMGFSLESFKWAFTTFHSANWHPLTWFSHLTDVSLFGLDARWHHRVNIALHVLNTLLLYLLFREATGSNGKSLLVAALFGVHPLHVESVAWITERKDLLYGLFSLLTLWAHIRFAKHGGRLRYLSVMAWMLMALMSKPMAVTLPFALLLMDFWPLGRLDLRKADRQFGRIVLEKVPLLAFSVASSVMTYVAQRRGEAISDFALWDRVGNALVSLVKYLVKMVWPTGLAVYYPHPASIGEAVAPLPLAGAILLLGAITVIAVRSVRSQPYLFMGWFWYVGTMVPVLGLVQTGSHAMADRFVYLPLVGILIVVGWGGGELFSGRRRGQPLQWVAVASVVLGFSVAAWLQVATWKDSLTLFDHALRVTRNNWMALELRGLALAEQGDTSEAIASIRKALLTKPDNVPALISLGTVLNQAGKLEEAEVALAQATRAKPNNELAHYNLAVVLAGRGRYDEAAREYLETLRLNPDQAYAHNNLGDSLLRLGRRQEALEHFREALRLDPGDSVARQNLQRAQSQLRQ